MVIGFWISLFIFIISLALLCVYICNTVYENFSFKLICGLLIGLSIFGVIFFGYYSGLLTN